MHSYIEYADGSLIAQTRPGGYAPADPIRALLSGALAQCLPPRRSARPSATSNSRSRTLSAFRRSLLARQAGIAGNTYPTVLSAADEVAVERFLRGEIGFLDIAALVHAARSTRTHPMARSHWKASCRRSLGASDSHTVPVARDFPACVEHCLLASPESLRYRDYRIGLNGVGARIVLRIRRSRLPSFSDSARTCCHSGSARKAPHFGS